MVWSSGVAVWWLSIAGVAGRFSAIKAPAACCTHMCVSPADSAWRACPASLTITSPPLQPMYVSQALSCVPVWIGAPDSDSVDPDTVPCVPPAVAEQLQDVSEASVHAGLGVTSFAFGTCSFGTGSYLPACQVTSRPSSQQSYLARAPSPLHPCPLPAHPPALPTHSPPLLAPCFLC